MPRYSIIPQCTDLLLYLPPCNEILQFRDISCSCLGTLYGWICTAICTAISAMQIQQYQVPRREQEISLNSNLHNKVVCTATEQYKVVCYYTWTLDTRAWNIPMQHCAIPSMYRYCCKFTWYALGTNWELDWFPGLHHHCYITVRGHSCNEYVLVCIMVVQVCTQYVLVPLA